MKKFIIPSLFMVLASTAMAEGYAGAVAAFTSIGGGCDRRFAECDKKGFGGKVFFGSKFVPSNQVDLGVVKLDSLEVGFISFGKSNSHGLVQIPGLTDDSLQPVMSAANTSATANALVAAAVARMPLNEDFAITAKAGGAYVSSTIKYFLNGGSNASKTATKLQPYFGFGLEFGVASSIKLIGSYDWTRFNVENQKGNLGAFGFGAQFGF